MRPVSSHLTVGPKETDLQSCFRKNLVLLQDAGTVFRLGNVEKSDAFNRCHFQDLVCANSQEVDTGRSRKAR